MYVTVLVKLGASKSRIESFGNNRYHVYVCSDNHQEANEELAILLSRQLGTPLSRIALIKGHESNEKMLEVR